MYFFHCLGHLFDLHLCVCRHERLNGLTQAELQTYVDKLNNRPRKKLGYRTPAQVFKAGSVALRV